VPNEWAENSDDTPDQEAQVTIPVKASELSAHRFPDPLDYPRHLPRLSSETEESPPSRTLVPSSYSFQDQDARLGSTDMIADGTDGPQIGRVYDESPRFVFSFSYEPNLSLKLKR
jgi:hypothetical protein